MFLNAVLSGLVLGLVCAAPLMFLSPQAFEFEDEPPFGNSGSSE